MCDWRIVNPDSNLIGINLITALKAQHSAYGRIYGERQSSEVISRYGLVPDTSNASCEGKLILV